MGPARWGRAPGRSEPPWRRGGGGRRLVPVRCARPALGKAPSPNEGRGWPREGGGPGRCPLPSPGSADPAPDSAVLAASVDHPLSRFVVVLGLFFLFQTAEEKQSGSKDHNAKALLFPSRGGRGPSGAPKGCPLSRSRRWPNDGSPGPSPG